METEAARRVLIACRSVRPELEMLRPAGDAIEIRYMDQNLHRTPETMTAVLQEAVDKLAATDATEIVLGYGLCSNGVVGLVAPRQGLIVPRVHDCIALFLGSREEYDRRHRERPGTYYLTPGWIAEKKDPLGYMESDYVPRMGREDAESGLKEELEHYTHIALIDTKAADPGPLRERATANARFLGMEYEEIDGDPGYLRRLLFGPYDDGAFVRVAAGDTVSQDPFF